MVEYTINHVAIVFGGDTGKLASLRKQLGASTRIGGMLFPIGTRLEPSRHEAETLAAQWSNAALIHVTDKGFSVYE